MRRGTPLNAVWAVENMAVFSKCAFPRWALADPPEKRDQLAQPVFG